MKNFITIIFVTLAISANAQTSSIQESAPLFPATPESAGMSSERLSRIDAMCKEYIEDGDIYQANFTFRSTVSKQSIIQLIQPL